MRHVSASRDRARALMEDGYAKLARAFAADPDPVYQLRAPWLAPCTLGESHTVNGSLQAVTLIHGPWTTGEPHIRVTTWRDLPGQDFVPDVPDDLPAAAPEDIGIDVDGSVIPATLVRGPAGSWLLRADPGRVHLLASGRGPIGDLSFEPLTDLEAVVNARRVFLASLLPEA
ncbi:hypothetical protein [Streptomyces sp. HPF1205]|uniref:hypothetical protein n=1 Tax=Streptomyces sp. HPF1205 TaxID=2873262 RepID=UPI001CEDCFBE|nr:hypothetical protein [Streptomyces sp. HPF1205]